MNDTLKYMKLDPVYRQGDHNLLTFSMAYFIVKISFYHFLMMK